MKRFLILGVLLILFWVAFIGGILWFRRESKPVSQEVTKVRFIIPKGYTAGQIGMALERQGLIRSSLAFKVYVQIKNASKSLKPGEYNLSRNLDLRQIVAKLLVGPDEFWVTIPEGLRREEVVEKFIQGLELTGEMSDTFRRGFLVASEGKEGYLFPDTYLFARDITPENVVAKMILTFDQKIDEDMKQAVYNSRYSLDEIIIMASLIEREAKTDEERPVISGILWKRLRTNGWFLQVDSAVQYAIGGRNCADSNEKKCNWWPNLTREDLQINSPYNTYRYKSLLPPTPIANPGLSSIKAAIFPEESDYWFYIHDRFGRIHYAKTISEHNLNIDNYLSN